MEIKKYSKHGLEIKKRLVNEDKSTIFAAWNELVPSITKEDFIKALEWLCDDPHEFGNGTGRLTREIGLTTNGIIHINRHNDVLTTFYRDDTHTLWEGDFFTVPCIEKYITNADAAIKLGYADENGMIRVRQKISLSASDHI